MTDTTDATEAPQVDEPAGLTPAQRQAVEQENALLGQAITQAANDYLKTRVVALNVRVQELEAEVAALRATD